MITCLLFAALFIIILDFHGPASFRLASFPPSQLSPTDERPGHEDGDWENSSKPKKVRTATIDPRHFV